MAGVGKRDKDGDGDGLSCGDDRYGGWWWYLWTLSGFLHVLMHLTILQMLLKWPQQIETVPQFGARPFAFALTKMNEHDQMKPCFHRFFLFSTMTSNAAIRPITRRHGWGWGWGWGWPDGLGWPDGSWVGNWGWTVLHTTTPDSLLNREWPSGRGTRCRESRHHVPTAGGQNHQNDKSGTLKTPSFRGHSSVTFSR